MKGDWALDVHRFGRGGLLLSVKVGGPSGRSLERGLADELWDEATTR
jgi:hypothetical protein